jgi:mitochondrial fission protein ELM1
MTNPRTAWIVSPGQIGMKAQCRGLAEALGLAYEFKDVRFRFPYSWLPEPALVGNPFDMLAAESARLEPPWPDMAITLGSRCAPIGVAMKRRLGGKVAAIHVQRPALPVAWLDAVVAPRHDQVRGANVIETEAALHHVTRAKLKSAAQEWRAAFAALKRPLAGVILGGSNGLRRYRFSDSAVAKLDAHLRALAASGVGVALTTSRRTDAHARARLLSTARELGGYVYDTEDGGPNPYLGILALADVLVVTEDSVSMTSEALSTGKPVMVADLDGKSGRIAAFQAAMRRQGRTREFAGRLEIWNYTPPDDTARAAALLKARFGWG